VKVSNTTAAMSRRSHLIRNAAIAALVGSTAGAIAGFWSVRDRADSVAVSATATGGNVALSPVSPPTAVATRGVMPSTAAPVPVGAGSSENDSQKEMQRARALAEVPDVYALVGLRESISRRAEERGELESSATQALIRELDRYLADARRLRLKLDGEALRRDQTAKAPRTGR
jgi:hypothetical protein